MEAKYSNIIEKAPDNPDISKKYLFYLHGLIVEVAGIRPKSEEHGYYEYQMILEELAAKGFVVISEARQKNTDVQKYADYVASQVKTLLADGVVPGNITVIGASKGGAIAAYASNILQLKEINYVFLAGLFKKYLDDEKLKLHGNVLSIHDRSDKLEIAPDLYFERSHGLGDFDKITVNLGLGHGIIYKPYREWINPIMEWLNMK